MPLPLNNTDGFVKIYEMSAGGQGNIVTPSNGWEYVQGISLTETPISGTVEQVGATYQRAEWLGAKTVLDISRYHVGGDEFSFANDHSKDYLIKLLYYDSLKGIKEGSAHVIEMAYCRTMDRTIATGKDVNVVARKWFVGLITDNQYQFEDTSEMIWTEVVLNGTGGQTVNHQRGRKVFVWCLDLSGNAFRPPTQHTSNDSFSITSARPLLGTLYYA